MAVRPTRQLAAIMFADMVGYTALMQHDERMAMERRGQYRQALDRGVSIHGGQTVQYYGDGALTIFPSAIEAVRCAVDIQQKLNGDAQVPVRIGIHTGDIVQDAEGVYGDGVNVAARIQALAVPGSVLVSDKVWDEIKNQQGISTRALGRARLKNVDRPVGVWSVEAPGIASPEAADVPGLQGRDRRSVAVLPFVNMSADPDNEYFSDGISEEIINALTRIDGLKVTSRTSSFAFKDKRTDVREIAEALGVGTVLEGSVRRAGGRVRVTAQLIDASEGYHLFSHNYDRDLDDIFAIQDEISAEIVRELKAAIGGAKTAPAAGPRADVGTYSTVLRARHLWNQWSPEAVLRSIQLYEHAVAQDPDYAQARAGLAAALCFIGALGRQGHGKAYDRARTEAQKSLELDANNADAHVALGLVALFNEWDRKHAEMHLDTAAELNPGSSWVRHTRAMFYEILLDQERAYLEVDLALQMDPLSQPIHRELAQILALSGRHDEALEQLERTLELGPTFRTAIETQGWTLLAQDRYEEALAAFRRYASLSPSPYAGAAHFGYTLARMGRREEALEHLERLNNRREAEPDIQLHMDFATVHLGLGDMDRAFEWAQAAVDAQLGAMVFPLIHPLWYRHRGDPRFTALVEGIGLWEGLEERWQHLVVPSEAGSV